MKIVLNSYKDIRVYASQLGGNLDPPVQLDALADHDRIDRTEEAGGVIDKTISVAGNPLPALQVQPWLEEKALISAPPGYQDAPPTILPIPISVPPTRP